MHTREEKAVNMCPLKPSPLPSRGENHSEPEVASGLVNGRVTIVPHDPKWPYLFRREADRIRQVLGDRVLLIEHVGSTAVPDLDAKPCIDIQMAVTDPEDQSTYLPALEEIGYGWVTRFPGRHEHRLLKGSRVNVNLYVFPEGSAGLESMRLLRDHLIEDSEARERYAAFKRELGERRWERIQDYVEAKNEIVTELLADAEKRKAEHGTE